MQIPTLVGVLDQPHLAADHLHAWGLADVDRAGPPCSSWPIAV